MSERARERKGDSTFGSHPFHRVNICSQTLDFSSFLIRAVHIVFNMLLQLLFGIPLEMVHKGWRIMLIYILGVLIGALAHSVTDFDTMLW